jgi:outer membrane protein TolC
VLNRRPRYDDMVSLMLSFDLPWQTGRRQQPLADEKRRAMDRLEAEREDLARRLAVEVDSMLAELRAMDAMRARLVGPARQLAAERVALLTAGYQAGRNDLGAVLAARTQAIETRMKAIELDGQRAAMRIKLAAMVGLLGQDATGVKP